MDLNSDKYGIVFDIRLDDAGTIKVNVESRKELLNQDIKKIEISGTCVLSRRTPSLKARVQWWPNKFVDGQIEAKLDNKGFSSVERKFGGSLILKSSFIDDITAEIKHERSPGKIKTEGEVAWAPDKKTVFVFGLQKDDTWSDVNVKLLVDSPFRRLQKINSIIAYKLNGNQFSSNGQLGINDKHVTYDFSGAASWKNSAIELKATTPYEKYETVALLIKNSHNGRVFASMVKLDVNSQQKFGLDFNMDHEARGFFMKNSGSLDVFLPIAYYQTNKLTWNHENNARNFNSRIVIAARNKKLVFDFELKNKKVFSIKTKLLTPFIPDIYLSLEHENDRRDYVYKTSASVQYGENEMKLTNDLSLLSTSQVLKTLLRTPFINYEDINLDITTSSQGKSYEGQFKLLVNQAEYSITGNFLNNGLPALTLQIVGKCPHSDDISLKIDTEKQGNIWESRMSAQYLQDQAITFVATLGLNDLKKLSVDINSPFSSMKKASFDLEHYGSPKQFRTKVKMTHNMLTDDVNVAVLLDIVDQNDSKFELTGRSPLQWLRTGKAIIKHKFNGEVYQSDLILECSETRLSASNTLQLTNAKLFSDHLQLAHGSNEVKVQLQVNVVEDVFINYKQESTLFGEQIATIKHKGDWKNLKTSLSLTLDPSNVFSVETSFFLNGNNMDALLKIATPIEKLRLFEVVANHHGGMHSFENSVKVNCNSELLVGRIRSDVPSVSDVKIEVTCETPWEKVKNIFIEFKHKHVQQTHKTEFSFTSPGTDIGMSHVLEMRSKKDFTSKAVIKFQEDAIAETELKVDLDSDLAVDGSFRSTWTGEQKLSFMHKGTLKQFETTLAINPRQAESMVGYISFSLSDNRLNTLARITTPYSQLKTCEVAFSYVGSPRSFESEVKFHLNGRDQTAKIIALTRMDDVNWKLTATTTFAEFEHMELAFTHKYGQGIGQTNFKGQLGSKVITASNMLEFTSLRIFNTKAVLAFQEETIAELAVNLNSMQNIDFSTVFRSRWTGVQMVSLAHQGGLRDFETTVKVSPKHKNSLVFYMQATCTGNSFNGRSKLTTPYSSFEIVEVSVNHDQGRGAEFMNNLMMKYNKKQFDGQLSVNINNMNDMSIKLSAGSPFTGFEKILAQLSHKFDGRQCQSDMKFETTSTKTSASNFIQINSPSHFIVKTTVSWMNTEVIASELNVNVENIVAIEAQLTTSWTGKHALSFTHNGDFKNFETACDVSPWESQHITLQMQSSVSGTKVNSNLKITSPFDEVKSFDFTLNHVGSCTNFVNEVTARLNNERMKTVLNIDLRNINDISLNLAVTLPLEKFMTNNMLFKHKMDGQTCQTDFKSQVGQYKVGASNTLEIKSDKVFRCKTNILFQEKDVAGLEIEADVASNIVFNAKFDSQWTGQQSVVLLHEGGWKNLHTTVKIGLTQDNIIALEAESSLSNGQCSGFAQLTTPYAALNILKVSVNHNGRIQSFVDNVELILNEKKFESQLTVDYANINDMDVKLVSKTPFDGFEEINSAFLNKLSGQLYKTELVFKAPMANLALSNLLEIKSKRLFNNKFSMNMLQHTVDFDIDVDVRNDVALSGKFQSSWTGTQSASMSHKGTWTNFQTSVTVSPRISENIVADAQFSIAGSRLSSILVITTPYSTLDVFETRITHQGTVTKFSTECYLNLNSNKNTLNLGGDFQNVNQMSMKVTALTSVVGFSRNELVLTHRSSNKFFQTDIQIQHEEETYTMSNVLEISNYKTFSVNTYVKHREDTVAEFQLNVDSVRKVDALLRTNWSGKQTASFNHQGQWRNFETTINISPSEGDHIAMLLTSSLQGYNYDGLVKITAPYDDLKIFEVAVGHKGEMKKFDNRISVTFNEMVFQGKMIVDVSNINDLQIKITGNTPFTDFRLLKGLFQHQFTGGICKTELVLEAPTGKIAASNMIQMRSKSLFNTKTSLNMMKDKMADLELDVDFVESISLRGKFASSWTGIQSASLIHQGPMTNFQTKVTVSPQEEETMTLQIQMSKELDYLNGLVKITSPYSALKNFDCTVQHQGTIRKFSNNVVINFNEEKIEYEFDADSTNWKDVNVRLTGQTTFEGVETINGKFIHKFGKQQCQTQLVLESPMNKIVLSHVMKFRQTGFSSTSLSNLMGQKTEASLSVDNSDKFSIIGSISSPYTGEKNVSVVSHGTWQNFEASVIVSPKKMEVIDVRTKFTLQDVFDGNLKVRSSYSDWDLTHLDFHHTGSMWKFENELDVGHKQKSGGIRMSVDLSDCNNLHARISGETPFQGMEKFSFDFNHKQTLSDYNTGMEFMMSQNKVKISNLFKFNEERGFNSDMSFECYFMDKVGLSIDIDLKNTITAAAEFTSPWTGTRTLNLEHSGKMQNFQTEISLRSPTSQTLKVDVQFTLNGNDVNSKVSLESAFAVIRLIEVTLSHKGDILAFENHLVVKHNNDVGEAKSKFSLGPAGVSGKLEVETPFTHLRKLSFIMKHEGDFTSFNSEYELDYMGRKTVFTGVYNFRNSAVSGKFELRSPYRKVQSASLEFTHKGDILDFQNNGIVTLNDKQYAAESAFSLKGNVLDLAAKIQLHHDYSLEMNHNGNFAQFANKVTLRMDAEVIMAQSYFQMVDGNIQTSVALKTPFVPLRNANMTYKHNGNLLDFECEMNARINGQVMEGKHTWKFNERVLLHSLTVTTPFEGYSVLKYKLSHQEKRGMIKQNLLLSLEEEKMEVKTAFKRTTNRITGNMNIITPFKAAKRMTLILTHKMDDSFNFNTDISISLNSDTITLSSSCSKQNNMVEASVNVVTPFQRGSQVNAIFKHTGPRNSFSNELTLSIDNVVMSAGSSFRLQSEAISADVSIETPFNAVRLLNVRVSHYGSGMNFNNNMTGTYNDHTISSAVSMMVQNGEIKTSVQLQSPFKGYRHFASRINLRKEPSSFNSELAVEMGRRKAALRQRLILRDGQSEFSIILETPLQGYRNMGLRFKHIGSVKNFNAELMGYKTTQKVQVKSTFKIQGSKMDLKLTTETPFESFSKAGVHVSHEGNIRDFHNVISLNLKETTIDQTSVFNIRGDKVSANFTLLSPFSLTRLVKFQMFHSGNFKNFENVMTLTYNKYNIRSNGKFALEQNSIEVNYNVQTPFEGYRNLAVTAIHKGRLIPSQFKCVINLEDERISLSHDIANGDFKFDASLLIETTFPIFNKLGYTVSHNGPAHNFITKVNLFLGSGAVEGDCKFTMERSAIHLETGLKTPFEGFTQMGVNFKQNGLSWNFNNEGQLYLEDKVISSVNSMQLTGQAVTVDFKIETPFQRFPTLGIIIKHEGGLREFNNEVKMYMGQETISTVNSFKLARQTVSADFILATPFEGFATMGITLKHRGPPKNFNNQVKIYLENKAITSVNKFEFRREMLSGDFTLVTPFTGYSLIGMNVKHEGVLKRFSNEIKMYIESKAITSTNRFEMDEQTLSADFKIETPFERFSSMGAVARHQGQPKGFNNEVKVYLENNVITSINSFAREDDIITLDFSVETSFIGFSKLGISAKHQGLARSFKNELKMYIEDNVITSLNNLEIKGRTISADFTLQTPFEGYTSNGLAIKHRGLPRNFNNEVKMYAEQNVIKIWSSFQVEGKTLSTDIKAETSFVRAKILAFKLTHSGHLKNFKNHLMTTYNDYKFENRNSFVLYRQKMIANVALETPFAGYRNLGLSVKRIGLATDFTLEVMANKEDIAIDGKCASKVTSSSYMLTSSLTGPFGNVNMKINHEGILSDFKSEASLQVNSHQYNIITEGKKMTDALTLSCTLTKPEKYGIVFEHKGPWTGFNNKLHMIVADEPHIATSSFSYGDGIEANVNVESSKFPIALTFKHGGKSWRNFQQESSLSLVGQTYQHKCEFMLQGRKVNGLITLDTPHEQLRLISLTIRHQGRWNNFENHAALQFNEHTVNANSQLTVSAKRVKGGIYVRIPAEYSVEIIQKGPKTDLTAIVKLVTDNNKSQLNTDFRTKNDIMEGAFELRSAYLRDNIQSSFNFNKEQGTFSCSVTTPFENFENMNAEISHHGHMNDFITTLKLATPFTQFRDVAFEIAHKGNSLDFAQSWHIDVNGKQVSGDITFVKTRQNMQATINTKTPFSLVKTGHAKLTHQGSLKNFKTNGVIQWNNKKIEGAVDFKKARTIVTNVVLTTPFEAIADAALKLNCQGTFQNFEMSSDASLNGHKISGVVNFVRRGSVLESTGTLTTPFSQLKEGSYKMNHRGDLGDFATSGEVIFNSKVLKGEVVHKISPEIMTTVHLSTPWDAMEQAKINLNHRGNLLDFTTILSGQWNGQVIDSNLGFTMTDNDVKSSAAIRTPFAQFRELAYTYTHDIQPQNLKATVTLTLPLEAYKNFRGEFDLTGSLDDFRGTIKVNTPFDALPESVTVVTHKGGLKAFDSSCSFVAASRNIQGEITMQRTKTINLATVKISTPYRKLNDLYFETKNEKKGPEMTTHIEATYNGEKHFDTDFTINTGDLTYAVLNIHAPVNVEIRGRNKRRTKEMSFNIPSVVYLTTSYQKEKGKFTQATQLQLGSDARNKFAYTVEGTKAINNQQVSYGGKLNLESRHGSFESGLNHVINRNNQQYITNVKVQRLQLNSDIILQDSLKSVFKVSHPSLNKVSAFLAILTYLISNFVLIQ